MLKKEDIRNLAKIAHIAIDERRVEKYFIEMNNIIDFVSILDSVDCDSEDTLRIMMEGNNRFRADVAKPSFPLAEALQNAPNKNENFFKVPKFIE